MKIAHLRIPRALPLISSILTALIVAAGCARQVEGPPLGGASAGERPGSGAANAAAAGGLLFVDAAEAAGLRYRWPEPEKRPLTILQSVGHGCAFVDYDNDGNLDILLVSAKPALFRGDGAGKFTDVTETMGLNRASGQFVGCAVGDYDNDGYDDVYLSAYRGGALLRNEGGKRFREVTTAAGIKPQPWGTSCSFADMDSDGRLDLYIGNYVVFGPKTDPQLCDMNGHMSSCGPRFYQPERGALYRNEGGGKFRDVTKAWGAHAVTGKALGVAVADYDGSGRQSIAIANDEVAGDLLQNKGKTLKNIGAASGTAYDGDGNVHGGMGIDWGDYDNDGKLDLFVATFQNEAKCVYRNEGEFFSENSAALGMAPALPLVTFGSKWLDFDNDGWLDLMLANGHVQDNIHLIDKTATFKQPTQLFRSKEGASFEDVSPRLEEKARRPIMGRGLAVGDYDNDGKVDALVVDSEGAPLLLRNQSSGNSHWLSCRLIGAKSNKGGIGALVTVEAGGMKQVRRCATDGSYLSASDKRVHFGLGKAAAPVTVTVRWPSGATSTHKDVAVDRIVTLREGETKPL